MLFLKIYIGFSILTLILLLMQTYILSKQFKREYPDIANDIKNKSSQQNILEKIFIWTKTFITCFVPIANICIFYSFIFQSDEVKASAFNKIKEGF